MIIYLATREEFLTHVREQRIETEVFNRYTAITGQKVAANEIRSWKNSLQPAFPIWAAPTSTSPS